MSRGVAEDDVWLAADALLLEGFRPTIERVRQKIGRGSPNTVSPYLDSWFKHLGGRIKDPGAFSAPPEIPNLVLAAAKQLWESAQAGARADLELRLQAGMAAAVANVESEKERAAVADAAAFEAAARSARLQNALEARKSELEAARLASATLEVQLDESKRTIQDLQGRLQQASLQLKTSADKHDLDLSRATERSVAAERRAGLEIDAERMARRKLEKRSELLEKKIEVALADLHTADRVALTTRLEAEQLVNALGLANAELKAQRGALQAEAEQLAAARQLLDQARAEGATLRSVVEQLTLATSRLKRKSTPRRRNNLG